MKSLDLIVLGGGSGGLAVAQRAAEYGARVAIFEHGRLGGTCVNVGCVPKKVMWNAAEIAHTLEQASHYGFDLSFKGHDWGLLKRGRDAYVKRLNGIYRRNLDNKDIVTILSSGRFASPREVVDEAGETYRADHVVIATGGYPKVPALPGAERGITSDGFFELEALPGRVAVVGSGYIAMELAGVLRSLGSEVSVFVRYDRVLREFDPTLSDHLMQHMRAAGMEIVSGAVPRALGGSDKIVLQTGDGRAFEGFDALLWAIGRQPNSPASGSRTPASRPRRAATSPSMPGRNTNVEGIYAIGDVTGRAGAYARRDRRGQAARRPGVRWTVGTAAELRVRSHGDFLASADRDRGPDRAQARERHGSDGLRVYKSEFVPMFNALTEAKPRTAMKLVTVGEDERVVGCHVIGPGADEMVQGFAVALSMGARKSDLDDTIAIHPTSAEELVTMR